MHRKRKLYGDKTAVKVVKLFGFIGCRSIHVLFVDYTIARFTRPEKSNQYKYGLTGCSQLCILVHSCMTGKSKRPRQDSIIETLIFQASMDNCQAVVIWLKPGEDKKAIIYKNGQDVTGIRHLSVCRKAFIDYVLSKKL